MGVGTVKIGLFQYKSEVFNLNGKQNQSRHKRARGAFGRFWPIFSFLPDFVGVFYNV